MAKNYRPHSVSYVERLAFRLKDDKQQVVQSVQTSKRRNNAAMRHERVKAYWTVDNRPVRRTVTQYSGGNPTKIQSEE